MDILVDSNVLLDVFTEGEWYRWSSEAVARHIERDTLFINPIIYAEVSVRFDTIEELDEVLPPAVFSRTHLPWAASFLAGKAHREYRRRGGVKTSTLPDFFVGAHAMISGAALLTRDRRIYQEYFPKIKLITPG